MRTRWATQDEIARLPLPDKTVRVLVLDDGSEILAVASMLYDGEQSAPSCYLDFLKPVPKVALHRFGLAAVEAARRLGVAAFFAYADKDVPRSEAWLERLGMIQIGTSEKGAVYRWEAAAAAS